MCVCVILQCGGQKYADDASPRVYGGENVQVGAAGRYQTMCWYAKMSERESDERTWLTHQSATKTTDRQRGTFPPARLSFRWLISLRRWRRRCCCAVHQMRLAAHPPRSKRLRLVGCAFQAGGRHTNVCWSAGRARCLLLLACIAVADCPRALCACVRALPRLCNTRAATQLIGSRLSSQDEPSTPFSFPRRRGTPTMVVLGSAHSFTTFRCRFLLCFFILDCHELFRFCFTRMLTDY